MSKYGLIMSQYGCIMSKYDFSDKPRAGLPNANNAF